MFLILFDIDGTLIVHNEVSTLAFRKSVAEVFAIQGYSEVWDNYINDSDIGILQEIVLDFYGRNATMEEILHFQDVYYDIFLQLLITQKNDIIPVPGIHSFFESLSKMPDVRIALFTGGFPKIAITKLRIININSRLLTASAFDGISREIIFNSCIKKAEQKSNCSFDNIVFFGDSFSDIQISHRFKIPLIGVTTLHSADYFKSYGINSTIESYDVGIEVLKRNVNY